MSKTMYTDRSDIDAKGGNAWGNFDRKASMQHKANVSYLQGSTINLTPKSMSKTAQENKRQAKSVMRNYTMSVHDTVMLGSKAMRNTDFGIKNYHIKQWHHDIDKPIVYGIHQDKNSKKPRHFLDAYLKTKAIVPSPNTYNMSKDFTIKQNPLYSKSPRVMEAD